MASLITVSAVDMADDSDTLNLSAAMKTVQKNSKLCRKHLGRGVVYIKNIPHGFYEEEMKHFFRQFGTITHIVLARSKTSGKSKGFAYIEFLYRDIAKIVADTMNNYLMAEKLLKTKFIPSEQFNVGLFYRKHPTEKNYPHKKNRKKNTDNHNSDVPLMGVMMKQKKLEESHSRLMENLENEGIKFEFQVSDAEEQLVNSTAENNGEYPASDESNDMPHNRKRHKRKECKTAEDAGETSHAKKRKSEIPDHTDDKTESKSVADVLENIYFKPSIDEHKVKKGKSKRNSSEDSALEKQVTKAVEESGEESVNSIPQHELDLLKLSVQDALLSKTLKKIKKRKKIISGKVANNPSVLPSESNQDVQEIQKCKKKNEVLESSDTTLEQRKKAVKRKIENEVSEDVNDRSKDGESAKENVSVKAKNKKQKKLKNQEGETNDGKVNVDKPESSNFILSTIQRDLIVNALNEFEGKTKEKKKQKNEAKSHEKQSKGKLEKTTSFANETKKKLKSHSSEEEHQNERNSPDKSLLVVSDTTVNESLTSIKEKIVTKVLNETKSKSPKKVKAQKSAKQHKMSKDSSDSKDDKAQSTVNNLDQLAGNQISSVKETKNGKNSKTQKRAKQNKKLQEDNTENSQVDKIQNKDQILRNINLSVEELINQALKKTKKKGGAKKVKSQTSETMGENTDENKKSKAVDSDILLEENIFSPNSIRDKLLSKVLTETKKKEKKKKPKHSTITSNSYNEFEEAVVVGDSQLCSTPLTVDMSKKQMKKQKAKKKGKPEASLSEENSKNTETVSPSVSEKHSKKRRKNLQQNQL